MRDEYWSIYLYIRHSLKNLHSRHLAILKLLELKNMKNFIVFLFSLTLFSAETDHYTYRDKPLEEASEVINSYANSYLLKSVGTLNSLGTCDDSKESEMTLYKELRKYFANHSSGILTKNILHDNIIDLRMINLNDSVYANWGYFNGRILGKKGAELSPLALAPMMNINGKILGTDKLEHLFGMGFHYFKWHYIKGRSLRTTLKRGVLMEKTSLGGNIIATGVFSYADLAANFNGMRFWNHILQKREDVLGLNLGPFVKCENSKWKIQKEKRIDFSKYLDDSTDESLNCSKFASKNGLKKFKEGMIRLSIDNKCPMNNKKLSEVIQKYSIPLCNDDKCKEDLSKWIINKNGNQTVKYFSEIKGNI